MTVLASAWPSLTRLLLTATGVLTLALVAYMLRAANAELALDFRPTRGPIAAPPLPGLDHLTTVNLAAADQPKLAAFYQAGTQAATMILLHGTAANRAQLLPEAAMLARHGFGVLLLDWPGHGESAGQVHWDEPERVALTTAVHWLERQSPPSAIGVLAFSMGCWITLQVAPTEPKIGAVVLAGGFASARSAILEGKGTRLGPFAWLVRWPTLMAASWRHMQYDAYDPKGLIAQLAPRPVLLIAGDRDTDVPASASAELFAAAGEPKAFWLVKGATHGAYAAVAPRDYEQRLVGFFTTSLVPVLK